MTVTEKLRNQFGRIIRRIAELIAKTRITANQLTIFGFVGNFLAAVLIANGKLSIGGLLTGISCLLDALDGTVAKMSGSSSPFGSLLDSTLDRYSETFLYLGLLYYYLTTNDQVAILFVFLAFSGSILVSYIRARSEGLGIRVEKGIMTRVERIVVLVFSLLARYPIYGLFIIAIFSHFTAIQRFFLARRILIAKDTE